MLMPMWVKRLPSNLCPNAAQIRQLENLRKEIDLTHEWFSLHILGHPETTRKLQRQIYMEFKQGHPDWSESQLLAGVLRSRLASSVQHGSGIFDLKDAPIEEVDSRIQTIVQQYPTIADLTNALLAYEEAHELVIPPVPEFEGAAQRVGQILAEG